MVGRINQSEQSHPVLHDGGGNKRKERGRVSRATSRADLNLDHEKCQVGLSDIEGKPVGQFTCGLNSDCRLPPIVVEMRPR